MARHIRFEDLPAWLQPTNFADDEDAIIVSMKELGLPDGMNVRGYASMDDRPTQCPCGDTYIRAGHSRARASTHRGQR